MMILHLLQVYKEEQIESIAGASLGWVATVVGSFLLPALI
jgi:hypothetical protein